MGNKLELGDAWKLIDELADESTKAKFELDDILYDISMKIFEFRVKTIGHKNSSLKNWELHNQWSQNLKVVNIILQLNSCGGFQKS